jgi:hypothetical protein
MFSCCALAAPDSHMINGERSLVDYEDLSPSAALPHKAHIAHAALGRTTYVVGRTCRWLAQGYSLLKGACDNTSTSLCSSFKVNTGFSFC